MTIDSPIVTGSLTVTEAIKGMGSIYLQPDTNDGRQIEIYNTAASDTHIKATGGLTFLGDDTNYVLVDDYADTITINSVNGVVVSSPSGSLTVSGSLNITGSQNITGSSTLTGSLGITGSTTFTGSVDITGSTILSGSLNVTGSTTFTGSVDISGSSTLTGSLGATGSIVFTGSLDVTGSTVLSGSLNITGSTTLTGSLDITGSTTLTGSLGATGSIVFTGSLELTGSTILSSSLNVTGSTTLTGSLDVTGSSTLTGSLGITGSTLITGSLELTGSTILSGSLNITGSTVLTGSLDITGSSILTGSLNISGSLTTTDTITAQTLVVQTITSSVDFVTGSTRFGSILDNTHVFSGSVTMNPGGLFVSSSGLVGIGTTTPTYALDVVSSTSGNLGRFYYTDGTYNPRLQITGDSTGITFFETFSSGANSIKFSIAGSNTLTLKGDDVGIGTTNPSYRLHVSGAFSSNPGLYVYGTTYGMVGVDRGSSASSAGVNYYTTGSQRWFTGIYENTNNFGFYNALSANFPMVITTGSRVGIGTQSPNSLLSVRGNADFGDTGYSFNGPSQYGGLTFPRGQIFFSNTNTQNQLYIAGNAYNNASGVFAYRNSSQPATAFGLDSGAFSFLTAGNGTADATISWTTVMAITNGGDVTMGGTGAIKIHSGTTGQRPTAAAGQIRYNTSFNFLEYYDGSNWVPVVGQTSPGSTASNPAESADEIKTYNPNATNGLYWIRQIGTVPLQVYCVFTDYTGAAIQGGPWTVPLISNDANTNFSTDGPTAAATFLSKCQAIGIASPGRGMENTRTTTEVYGAWLAVKRALWNNYSTFITNGNTGGGAVLRMPMININGAGGASDQRLVYNTSLGTHLPPNIDGDACNASQLFCGWWGSTDSSGWRVNDNAMPGPEDWNPSDAVNSAYNGNGIQSVLTVCVYK